uniref:Retrotransposon protein, putative, Ty3-gypsy subclass n=1 Tax=Oryza sativa subsp. japonica TaxID=39947 RepID=Q2QWB3_ORYSJ|nr:retrotransposon protein, putative, Ty3-gypsy subclass [Oryza sativa Japonica Group]
MPGPTGVIVVEGIQPSVAEEGEAVAICREVYNGQVQEGERATLVLKQSPYVKVSKVQIDETDPSKMISLRGDLGEAEAKNILAVIKSNIDIFTWGPDEVGGVSPYLIMNHLAVKPDAKLRKQKLRKMSADR